MTSERVTLADLDRTIAATFGLAPPPDPAKSTMTLDEAQDVSMGEAFHRPGLSVEQVREARSVLAYHAEQTVAVPAGPSMSEAQEAQLEAARFRLVGVARSKGRTASESVAYGDALMASVQKRAVTEGYSFDEVLALVDTAATNLRTGRAATHRLTR